MTQDEIIEMANKAGFFINDELTITSPFIEDICISPMLNEFAKLVAERERETCAKFFDDNDTLMFWGSQAAREIRARGEA